MIGTLPTELTVNNIRYPIRTDFRDALLIFEAFGDTNLTQLEKVQITLEVLFKQLPPYEDFAEAYEKALWFLNGGVTYEHSIHKPKCYDWEQDESIIFAGINKVAGKEVRSVEYLHLWTFLGYFNEIGEGMFSSVVSIRNKKAKHKKLEKYEQEFYRDNKEIIDFKRKYTEDELESLNSLDEILGINTQERGNT